MSRSDPLVRFDVFLYVVHLLGSGHLRRTAAIANQLAAADRKVCLVSGGAPLTNLVLHPAIEFVQLPPVRARDGDFSDLVDSDNSPVDDHWWAERCNRLLDSWHAHAARVLIVESYPFARRQMRREIIPLLELASPQAHIVSSVRDILQPKTKPGRIEEVVDLVNRFFTTVLVHGDRAIVSLEETFPSVARLNTEIVYTGYVDDAMAASADVGQTADIVVAAGGGAVGLALYQAAMVAAAQAAEFQWLVLVGHTIAEAEFRQLQESAPGNLSVQRNRPDYRALLRTAVCSISQAGYNTAVDLLQSRCKAVLVPYSADGEVEQTIRAGKLAELGVAVVLSEKALSARSLLDAINKAQQLAPPKIDLDLDGAANVTAWVDKWLGD